MTRRRWIADEVSGNFAALTGAHADHLSRVLRARVGQEFDISAGGAVRRGRITEIAKDRVVFQLGQELVLPALPELRLLLAIFKFDRMEWAIEKCTELGVTGIMPVIARRTDTHLAAAAGTRLERWRRLARQAAEQSRRRAPPEITPPRKLKEAVNLPEPTRIVLVESGLSLKDVIDPRRREGLLLAVGPEGGWTEDEMGQLSGAGWIPGSLGPTILRAETAAIAATAIALAQFS
ncbi:MAG TPA: RsmE family RNA methyltransferase [Terriglobales bacterium]|nr:RsmE family RNA methyltransferase [Terriglobales bacterium]